MANRKHCSYKLSVRILDFKTKKLLPCRVRVWENKKSPTKARSRASMNNDFTPKDAMICPLLNDKWFASFGSFKIDIPTDIAQNKKGVVPECDINIRVDKGLEYIPYIGNVSFAREDEEISKTIYLQRWTNMKEQGFLCGEDHVHMSVEEVGKWAVVEGMNFGSSLQWWNGYVYKPPKGKSATRFVVCENQKIEVSPWDVEIEHSWGAVYFIGLPVPFEIPYCKEKPNLEGVKFAKEKGALVCYQGGWSPEVVLDSLLGYVDVVNLCNNNFHLHKYQPRSRYSNLLNIKGFKIYPNTSKGMMNLNFKTYYRLLNLGLKIAAGAGTAAGYKHNLLGYNRSYVKCPKSSELKEFLDCWRQGKNFVTNGPMIWFNANSGKGPGDTINLPDKGGTICLNLQIQSCRNLKSAEIIINGKSVESYRFKDHKNPKNIIKKVQINIKESCWICLRAIETDELLTNKELQRYKNGDKEQPSRLRFAHTSPLYVKVGGKEVAIRKSVKEASLMLDAMKEFALKHSNNQYVRDLFEAISKAKMILAEKIY